MSKPWLSQPERLWAAPEWIGLRNPLPPKPRETAKRKFYPFEPIWGMK